MPEVKPIEIKNIGGRYYIDYERKRELWDFLMASYRGGLGIGNRYDGLTSATSDRQLQKSGYYPGLFRFRREEDEDYALRVQMTPYRPYARRIVKTFVKYVTKDDPEREGVDAFAETIADVDLKGTSLRLFTRNILAMYMALGGMNVLVDVPQSEEQPVSQLQANEMRLRPYAVPILPQQVVDYELDNYGQYKWCIIETTHIVNSLEKEKAEEVTRRTYWDANIWKVYQKNDQGKWETGEEKPHKCGKTPVIRVVEDDIDNDVTTPESWFFDLADINRAIYNLDSLDMANFYYQTLGILVVPGKSMGEDKSAVEISNHTAIFENGQEENGITRFVCPDGTTYESFDRKIEKLKLEMFNIAGLAKRKDTGDAESAEAKEWEFQDTNQFLASVAHIANYIEESILDLVAKHESKTFDGSIQYPTDYRIDDIMQLIAAALDLKQIGFTSEVGRKEVMKRVYRKMLPNLSPETQTLIDKEIDESEESDPLYDLGIRTDEQPENEGVNESTA